MSPEPQVAVTDRAADLALASSDRAAHLAVAAADRADRLSYEKGRRDAEVDVRLNGHEKRLDGINSSIERQATATDALKEEVKSLGSSFDEHIAVETALAAALEKATSRGISARAHYTSLGLFLVGVAGLLVGTGHTP
jgi:hypothetical protein